MKLHHQLKGKYNHWLTFCHQYNLLNQHRYSKLHPNYPHDDNPKHMIEFSSNSSIFSSLHSNELCQDLIEIYQEHLKQMLNLALYKLEHTLHCPPMKHMVCLS
ncbi:hypothetical protein LguiA_017081 [Lonicera macranthoides]